MKETAYLVNQQLVGIYTDPNLHDKERATDVTRRKQKLPTIIFLNSGFLHHVGPYRLYVKLAREFAKLGFRSFRFDLSGIGDSDIHRDNRTHQEQYEQDIQGVLNFLESERKDKEFVVLGICTGADNAHKTMVIDQRVVGAIAVDGYTYPTTRYYLNVYCPKFFSLSSWITLFKILVSKISKLFIQTIVRKSSSPQKIDLSWNRPPKEKTEKEYRDFIQRNVNILNVYTASWAYNYKEQLADVFTDIPFGDNIQTAYLEDAEHIFPLAEGRHALTEVVSSWLKERFIST